MKFVNEDDIEIAEFKPCVLTHDELAATEMVLVDDFISWEPWRALSAKLPGHTVDLGYDIKGNLVGIRLWDSVSTNEGNRLRSPTPITVRGYTAQVNTQDEREAAIRIAAEKGYRLVTEKPEGAGYLLQFTR